MISRIARQVVPATAVMSKRLPALQVAVSALKDSGSLRSFSSSAGGSDKDTGAQVVHSVHCTYVNKDGSETKAVGKVGENMLRVAHENGVDLEGACECSIACSTCHVYVDQKYYDQLPEPVEAEEDMLDQAFALKPNSRLGCQIVLTPELEGIRVTLPQATRNFYVDGHKPQPH